MPNKGDIKAVAIVVIGVVVAGYVMNMLRENEIVQDAIDGFDA